MEFEHSAAMAISFDTTQAELRRPFYLLRPEMHCQNNTFEARYGAVSGFGKTPEIAAIAFDLIWFNGSVENAAIKQSIK